MSVPAVPESCIADVLLGDSLALRQLRAMIVKVAPSDIPVLVCGPTGSGKEIVARSLHLASRRAGQFVAFNVCAISDTMFEDALFGHVRGAFTGASQTTKGYLAEARGGTLLLDEIGGLGLSSQAKLLRALETRCYRPVGGNTDLHSDFRLIAATNADLGQLVQAASFRDDLRYRLGAVVLQIPPLADRPEDIPVLVSHFLAAASPGQDRTLDRDAEQELLRYDWPGNVRELRHVIEAALVLAPAARIRAPDITNVLRTVRGDHRAAFRAGFFDRRMLAVLQEVGWRVTDAARELGVDRRTIYRRLQRLGVREPLTVEPPARRSCGPVADWDEQRR